MKNLIVPFILLTGFLSSSCEKEMNIELPSTEPKLVVEGSIERGGYPIVNLSKSFGFFGKVDESVLMNSFVRGAQVSVSDGSRKIQLKEYEINLGSFQSVVYTVDTADMLALSFLGEIGKEYELFILYEGDSFYSKTTIPSLNFGIDSFWVELPSSSILDENPTYRRLMSRYNDDANVVNFNRYFVSVNSSPYFAPYYSVSADNIINGTVTSMAISKGWNRFSDTADWMKLSFFEIGDTVDIKFCSIDKGVYDFYRTLEYSYGTVGNPFVAPMVVSSNISKGAFGIWAGYGSHYLRYIIPE